MTQPLPITTPETRRQLVSEWVNPIYLSIYIPTYVSVCVRVCLCVSVRVYTQSFTCGSIRIQQKPRVTPGRFSDFAFLLPTNRLMSADLPTFG